jgi:hypothetical protein
MNATKGSAWRWLVLAAMACGATAHGEFVENPDDNTLWIENGEAIDGWREGLTFAPATPGFRIEADKDGKLYSSGRYVPLDAAYPWLTWRVRQYIPYPEGYRGWTGPFLNSVGHTWLGQVTEMQEGIFAVNVAENAAKWPLPMDFMRLDLYGAVLVLDYIKMVREPADYVFIEIPDAAKERGYIQPDDELTFRVKLAEPAEDVSLRFFNSYTMPQVQLNASHSLQLRMPDEDKHDWRATVTLKSLEGGSSEDGRFKPGSILVKAVILGGGPGTSLWGTHSWPIETKSGD